MYYYFASFILFIIGFLQSTHNLPWSAAHSEIFIFFSLTAFCLGSVGKNKEITIHANKSLILLILLMLITWIQLFFGKINFFGDAFLFNIYIFSCALALISTQMHGENDRWIIIFAISLLTASLLSSIISIAQSLGTYSDSVWIFQPHSFRRPGSNIAQPNHIATLLIMGYASLIYLDQRLNASRTLFTLCGVVLILGMGITESRTGLISGILLFSWWFLKRLNFKKPPNSSSIVMISASLIIIFWIWPNFITYLQEGGSLNKQVLINTTSSTRLEMWNQIWQAAWMQPWFGWGIRGTSEALNAVQHLYEQSQPFTYAHNIILEFIIGIGFPLTIFLFFYFAYNFLHRIKDIKTLKEWYAFGLLIPLALHSLLEYPFAYSYLLIPCFLAIGILDESRNGKYQITISKKILKTLLILFSIILSNLVIEYIQLENSYRNARFREINIDSPTTNNNIGELRPIVLTQLEALISATNNAPKVNMSQDEIEELRLTAFRFPWPSIQSKYALALALNGNPQEANRQLKIIRAMHTTEIFTAIKRQWIELSNSKYENLNSIEMLNQ